MAAVLSAVTVMEGFTVIRPLFDGTPDSGRVENLGEQWEILSLYFVPVTVEVGLNIGRLSIASSRDALFSTDE